jgi:hypothetical protein
MELTGEKPGKKLGYILNALMEEVLIDPGKNSNEYLESRVLELNKLDESELITLAEAGRAKQAEEEAAALKEIAREHKVG